jgi:mRNA interferase MazF
MVMYPYTDLSANKRRPAVVVSANPQQEDLTLAFISSQNVFSPHLGEFTILQNHPEFNQTGLVSASKVRTSKLATLNRALITRRLGKLGSSLYSQLDESLIESLEIDTAPFVEMGRKREQERLIALHGASNTRTLLDELGISTS